MIIMNFNTWRVILKNLNIIEKAYDMVRFVDPINKTVGVHNVKPVP